MKRKPVACLICRFFDPYPIYLEYCVYSDCPPWEEIRFEIEVQGKKFEFLGISSDEINEKLEKSHIGLGAQELSQIWAHVGYPTYSLKLALDYNALKEIKAKTDSRAP